MSTAHGAIIMNTRVSVPSSINDITFTWQGGDTIRLERGNGGLLAFDPYGVLSNHDPHVGDVFAFGSFQLRCTARYEHAIEAERA